MKLDQRTLQILKNFATINPHLVVNPGSNITTINGIRKTIFAIATVEPVFEKMAIYDLSRFLSVLSLFENPELEFNDNYVTIKSGSESVNYTYADSRHLIVPQTKSVDLPKTKIVFDITAEQMHRVIKAISVLRLPEICFSGDGETITLSGIDIKDPTGDVYKTTLGETTETFEAVYNIDNIKIIPGNYKVKIAKEGISSFATENLTYFIALEKKKSKF